MIIEVRTRIRHVGLGVLCGLGMLSQAGCLSVEVSPQERPELETQIPAQVDRRENLSGMWEFREGEVVYDLYLDQHGNGTYDWEDGSFETTSLLNGQWKGKWVQFGNDREGGFEAQLGQDGMSARGRWWYTRIGHDSEPLQPGGQFRLTRKRARASIE